MMARVSVVANETEAAALTPARTRELHVERAVETFTRLGAPPRPTFPLVLTSVTVAVVGMHFDRVAQYSLAAFWIGIASTVILAVGVGHAVSAMAPRSRMLAALVLPTAFGAIVGVIVQ